MATHSSILAWRIPWTEEPGGLQSTAPQRVRHDWSNSAHSLAFPERWIVGIIRYVVFRHTFLTLDAGYMGVFSLWRFIKHIWFVLFCVYVILPLNIQNRASKQTQFLRLTYTFFQLTVLVSLPSSLSQPISWVLYIHCLYFLTFHSFLNPLQSGLLSP